jgi:hypothetical protein
MVGLVTGFVVCFRFGIMGPDVVDPAVDQPPGVRPAARGMSVSGQITAGRAGRHVCYSEVMSGSVDTFNLGRTKQSRVGRRS